MRDNIAWLATDSPAARAYNNAALTITTGTDTVLTLNSERFDNASVHSTSVNTGRMTIPSGGGGKYLALAQIAWANDTGGDERLLQIIINASSTLGQDMRGASATNGYAKQSITVTWAMSAADYVTMNAEHNKGSDLQIQSATSYSPEFQVFWYRT